MDARVLGYFSEETLARMLAELKKGFPLIEDSEYSILVADAIEEVEDSLENG